MSPDISERRGPRCDTEGCTAFSVGIHRHVGPTDRSDPAFGTTTPWEEACAEHFGIVVIAGVKWRANRTHRYGNSDES